MSKDIIKDSFDNYNDENLKKDNDESDPINSSDRKSIIAKPQNNNPITNSLYQTMLNIEKSIPKIDYSAISAVLNETVLSINNTISKIDFRGISEACISFAQNIETPFYSWISQIDFKPLLEFLNNIDFDNISKIDADYLYKTLLQTLYDATWFPYAGIIADIRILEDVFDILEHTKASKNRTKKIDQLMFSYYDKNELNCFKQRWRNSNLPNYIIRISCQAIQAYNRREYALTICSLSTLWEGLIQDKANDHGYRTSNKTKENLKGLIKENDYDEILNSFSRDYIFYDCYKKEDVIDNVPGRHGIAHSWYNSYPTRKAALNAILFTDFLISLS